MSGLIAMGVAFLIVKRLGKLTEYKQPKGKHRTKRGKGI